MTGGNSGQVLIAGDGTNSLIIQKLRGTAQGSQMPMGGNPLEESVISLLETWINEGANENPLSIKFENGIHPNQVSIIQNFPNPFNPVTHFQIFSPIQQSGKISIFNIAGQELIDLGIVHLNPGKQSLALNLQSFTNLSSGQYLFCLKSNDLIITRKFSFIK
jgi:hypothetical protein